MTAKSMIDIQHGRFAIAVPEGWADTSTMTFVAPVEEGLAAPLSPRRAPQFQSNVNVTLEVLPEGIDGPAAFLAALGDSLRSVGAEVIDVAPPAPFSVGDREGALVERKVVLEGQPVRQLTAAAFVGQHVIVASAATSESEIDRERPVLQAILGQVRYQDA